MGLVVGLLEVSVKAAKRADGRQRLMRRRGIYPCLFALANFGLQPSESAWRES
ncbi:Uncharacterised protein [Mycobacteroides abscessus subsp. abscessus]|nr:Uncharacterised protein [Mycobacteroides abscessus subsp. abscessus]